MTSSIRPVLDIDNNIELWGGKALALSRLGNNGFTIPDTLVISSEIYRAYVQQTLDMQQFESEISAAIHQFFPNRTSKLIFRSSANIESSTNAMCCGVFESIVHDPGHTFSESIRSVWNSTQSPAALGYYQLVGSSFEAVSMAVIVQQLHIEMATAVIHTYDIVNNLPRIVLEYSFHAPNSIVDGKLDAELAFVDSAEDWPSFISEKLGRQLIADCKKAEQVFNSHLELEAQIGEHNICYLQARTLI